MTTLIPIYDRLDEAERARVLNALNGLRKSDGAPFYNYFRDYDPVTGRYIQSDPIGLTGGINTFAYVRSNPSRGADPFGLCEDDSTGKPKRCAGKARV
jgi:RHS repeat-associated protein